LQPGATGHVVFDLNWEDLAFYDVDAAAWKVPQGTFQVMVGASSRDVRVSGTFTVASPIPSSEMANLALFQAVDASSSLAGSCGTAAVDGDPATRWTAGGASAWLTIDLGSIKPINRVRLK